MVAAALAAALCVGGVAAASGVMELIARPGGFGSAAEGFQPYSAQVGASVTDQGYTLSLDGIGVDEAFITLYATITGEEPIPKDERGRPELWKLRLRAEGKDLEFWGQDQEIEWVDDYTLKVSQRCPVARALPEQVELQVYSNELFYGVFGRLEPEPAGGQERPRRGEPGGGAQPGRHPPRRPVEGVQGGGGTLRRRAGAHRRGGLPEELLPPG